MHVTVESVHHDANELASPSPRAALLSPADIYRLRNVIVLLLTRSSDVTMFYRRKQLAYDTYVS